METRVIQLRTHQKNIDRYQGLLKTKLNETERQYLEKRVCEEKIAMLQLMEQQIKRRNFGLSRLQR
jgi:predicted house-cleaning noncanonical NTP pyrophosphatase (MazG superfamily)